MFQCADLDTSFIRVVLDRGGCMCASIDWGIMHICNVPYCPSCLLALAVPYGSGTSDMGFERCVYLSMGAWYLVVRELISS